VCEPLVGSWGPNCGICLGFGWGGAPGRVAENPNVRTFGSHIRRPGDRSAGRVARSWHGGALVVPSVARWDTWDWPLRSHSEAAPKDREGRRPARKHQATAGRSENLKVGSSISHGETTKRVG